VVVVTANKTTPNTFTGKSCSQETVFCFPTRSNQHTEEEATATQVGF
jgi:hypothetical protein